MMGEAAIAVTEGAPELERVLTPEGFEEVLLEHLRSEIQVFPARAWYPSSLGHPCDRFLVWRMTRWEEEKAHDPVLQAIFDQGRNYQSLIYDRLERMGFEVVREGDRPVQYRLKNGAVISGRPDGKLRGFRGVRFPTKWLLELKAVSGHEFDRVKSVEDLRSSPNHWTRGYYAQGQAYCLLEEIEHGAFVLYSKATGMLKLFPFELDYAHAEEILARAERLQGVVNAGGDPDAIRFDWKVCGRCGFLDSCYPAKDFGEGAGVIDDEDLIAQITRWFELREPHREYEAMDKDLKRRLKHEGISFAIAGDFVIEGAEHERKGSGKYVRYSIRRTTEPASEEDA